MTVSKFIFYLLIIGISLIYTRPFLNRGFFPTDDGEWAIVRLSEMIRELNDFQIPPRWSDYLNHGYGYPLFSFTYPLPYYLGSLIHLLGLSLTDSIKFLFVLSVILSGIFMFLLSRELVGNVGALVASLFYISAPYRLMNLYVRGSLGESLNFVLFPLLCYSSLLYLKKHDRWSFLLTSMSLTIMILTHNASALLFFPFWILFLLTINYSYKGTFKKLLSYYLPVIILGIGLSSYFLFPVILEKKYISLSQIRLANIEEYFLSPLNLGILNMAGFLLGLFSLRRFPFLLFFLGSVAFGIFLAARQSLIFWSLPPLSWLDFPFRLFGPLTFLLALTTGFIAENKTNLYIGLLTVATILIYNLQYVKPMEYLSKPDSYYATNDATTTSNDELMPIWVKEKPTKRYQEKVEVVYGEAEINSLKYASNNISFNIRAISESKISINTLYFPGWEFILNEKRFPIEIDDKKGTMNFSVPPGEYDVKGRFLETDVRKTSNITSLLTLLISLLIIMRPKLYGFAK